VSGSLRARVPLASFPIGARTRLVTTDPDGRIGDATIPTPHPWRVSDLIGRPVTVDDVVIGSVVNVETRDDHAIVEIMVTS